MPADRPGDGSTRIRWWGTEIAAAVAILVPFLVMAWTAANAAVGFDGAMNLQVARNIAEGDGFVRHYNWNGGPTVAQGEEFSAPTTVVSPEEIQTSGWFLLFTAAAIKVFGAGAFSYQLFNLCSILGLLVVASVALRPWPLARFFGPAALLLLTPQVVPLSLGALGEVPVAAMALTAFLLLGIVAEGAGRPHLLVAVACALVGVAITVKTVAVAIVPVLCLGLLGVRLARSDVRLWQMGCVGGIAGLVPIVTFELYRMRELGGFGRWQAYWTSLDDAISRQAAGRTTGSMPAKVGQHLEILGQATGLDRPLLLALLVLPVGGLLAAFLLRSRGWRSWFAAPRRLVLVQLVAYQVMYMVWWLALTPTDKAWIRRLVIGLIAGELALLLLAGMAVAGAVARWQRPRFRTWVVAPGAVLALVLLAALVSPAWRLAHGNLTVVSTASEFRATVLEAAAYVRARRSAGAVFCAQHWFSAPAVALYADVPLCNLDRVKVCHRKDARTLASGRVHLLWDHYAKRLARPAPTPGHVTVELVAQPSPYLDVYRVTQKPDACPPATSPPATTPPA